MLEESQLLTGIFREKPLGIIKVNNTCYITNDEKYLKRSTLAVISMWRKGHLKQETHVSNDVGLI
jgi:hypothetical protein